MDHIKIGVDFIVSVQGIMKINVVSCITTKFQRQFWKMLFEDCHFLFK